MSGVDAQIINGQEYADSVWGNGARAFSVVGTATPKKGDKVTFSGAKTGEVNSIPVIDSAPRVGTDSFESSLGYAVPPGAWGVQATLDPAISEPVRTPVLPITVTA